MDLSAKRFRDPAWLGYTHYGRHWTPFTRYPLCRGFHPCFVTHDVSQGGEPPQQIQSLDRDSVAFYQSWHTFGFLEAVFEQNIPEYVLLKQDNDNGTAMTLDNLPMVLRAWAVAVYELSENNGNVQEHLDRATATQRVLYNQHLGLVAKEHFYYPGADHNEIRRMVNYIACLGEAVSITASGLHCHLLGSATTPPQLKWTNIPAIDDPTLFQAIVADGWCPSTINYLTQTTTLAVLRLALLRGPFRQGDHTNCSGEKCTAYEVDVDSYVARHTLEGCNCQYVRPNTRHIRELLGQRSVPVIVVTVNENDHKVTMSVRNGSRMPFVAISHVWADGLGSTSETGLPCCQIRRLARLTSKLVDSGAFWLDALCVPGDRELRNQSIRLMAETYRKAKAVLVLDCVILECHSTADIKEKMLCIQLSSWVRRLWTLQEAILSAKLFFQFADSVVTIGDMTPSFGDQLIDPVLTGLGLSMVTLSARGQKLEYNITDIARAMQWRSTSKASDETIAIASLLDIDAYELLNTAPSERMKVLYLRLHNLPKTLPFLALPKLEIEGFRWAPSTFLFPSVQQMARHDVTAICTPEGLIAEYYALRFDELSIEQQEKILLIDHTANQPYLLYKEIPLSGPYRCNTVLLLHLIEAGTMAEAVAVLLKAPTPL